MKRPTYSISIGIVVIGLAGVAATGCGDSGGLQSARTDGGASDAAASLGGQAGSPSAASGTAGTPGTGGEAGTKGTAGGTGSPGAGGEAGTKGTGGGAGSGGTIGSGGTKKALDGGADAAVDVLTSDAGGTLDGAADAGAKDGSVSDTRAVPDASVASDAAVVCGPMCGRYCAYGNVLDENGCLTCTCNSPPPCPAMRCQTCAYGYVLDANGCLTCTCNSPPSCPEMKCQACTYGYLRDANGCLTCTCAPDPSVPCGQLLDLRQCGASTHCRWLAPGCAMGGTPLADSESGCYEWADCTATSDCARVGSTCVERIVDPDPYSSGGDWCGMTVHICL